MRFILVLLLACTGGLRAELKVVTTTADLGAIVRVVGGDKVKVTVLARPTEDPHFVDPKPSLIVQLNRADLLIEGGAELESGWLTRMLESARNPKIRTGSHGHLAASEGIQFLEIPSELDRSEGDIHAKGNPHYLVDPLNAKIVSQNIARKLCELDPSSCAQFERNQKAFAQRIDEHLRKWQEALKPYQGAHIAAYHNSWPYFGHRFGLKIDLFLEPKPGIPPTPASLSRVIQEMKGKKVKVIICDPYLNHKTAERVAEETGATVVETSHFPGGIKGIKDDYISLIDYLVTSIAKGLAKP